MILPFSKCHQEKTAITLARELHEGKPAVVHVLRFPKLSINHALLAFGVHESPQTIVFDTYDPNQPDAPVELTYDRARRSFSLAANKYFPGGMVRAYEVYNHWYY